MPYVFTDEVGSDHIQILDSPNWTVQSAVLPNGNNAIRKTAQTGFRCFGVVGAHLSFYAPNALEFWIKPLSAWPASGNEIIIYTANINFGAPQLYVQTNGVSGSNAILNLGTGRGAAVNVNISIDVWHHIVMHGLTIPTFTVSSAGTLSTYVDGVPGPSTGTGSNSFRPAGADDTTGIHLMAPTTTPACHLAKISFYTKVLSQAEVTQHNNAMVSS